MKKEIKEFIIANKFERRLMIRAGFELETQLTDGMGKNDDGVLDEEAYDEAVGQRLQELIDDLPEWLSDRTKDRAYDDASEHASDLVDRDEFYKSPLEVLSDQLSNNNNDIEVVEDGSVDGFEFRTVGGLTYKRFMKAAQSVFNDFDHEIDTRCSFHIHLSLPGVKHFFGTSFQMALNEFLIDNQALLPQSVRERFKEAPTNDYIKGLVGSKAKYSFTHAHAQNTWEFRCFGNVQNASEAMACLNLAIEAMAYAYKVTHECSLKPILAGLNDEDTAEFFAQALETQTSLTELMRKNRVQERKKQI